MIFIYYCTMILNSAMLFLIELITAKTLLPQFGGSASVWTTCIVFYQFVLLLGYIYAHVSTKFIQHKINVMIQSILAIGIVFFLPIELSGDSSINSSEDMTLLIIKILIQCIGIPFFVLSTMTSTMQKWFEKTNLKGYKDPYFLYAASNIGSLLALILYPLYIEPNFTLKFQNTIILIMYSVLLVFILITGIYSIVSRKSKEPKDISLQSEHIFPMRFGRQLKWVMLAFVPSGVSISLTSFLSNDIAISPNPLLWSLPLLIYLFTFIIAFSKKPLFKIKLKDSFTFFLSLFCFIASMTSIHFGPAEVLIHLVLLFFIGMLCHGMLAEDRPNTKNLTAYYILISFGGALGGLFNALIAPMIFTQVLEYSFMIIAFSILIAIISIKALEKTLSKFDLILPMIVNGTLFLLLYFKVNEQIYFVFIMSMVYMGVFLYKNPVRLSVTLILYIAIYTSYMNTENNVLLKERDFYGTYQVIQDKKNNYTYLMNGNTVHGLQLKDTKAKLEPTTYYAEEGPLGQFFKQSETVSAHWNVGLIGLGVGSSLAYKKSSQEWTCFELSQTVVDIASNNNYFSFIQNYQPKIVVGDARVSLKKEKDNMFHVIIVDAFSSDFIPTHLLTKEAFKLYEKKLVKDGTILIHISNRVYKLSPVLANVANEIGIPLVGQYFLPKKQKKSFSVVSSEWCVLTKNDTLLNKLKATGKWDIINPVPQIPIWTDNYSSLLKVMKWK